MKKTIITLVFFFFFQLIIAQDWQTSYQQFMEHFQNGEKEKTLSAGNKTLQLFAEKDTSYLNVLRYVAYAHYAFQSYDTAVLQYTEARNISKKLLGTNNYTYQLITFNLAVNLTYTGDYEAAYPLLDEVLDYIVLDQGKHSMDYITIATQQANIYNIAGSYHKAAQIYEDVFSVIKSEYQESDSMYMVMVNTIAPFYFSNGMYEKAEPFYTRAVALMEEMYGKNSANYLASLNSLGEFYLLASMYDKAEKVFMEYVALCEKFYGNPSAEYATALNNLAVVYEKKGDYKKAEELYLKCIKIKEKVYKKESDFYCLTLSNLAVLYDNMGRFKEAETLLQEAIAIYKKIYGENHVNYAIALNNLASVYSSNGKYTAAIQLVEQALEIQKKLYGEKYNAYINSLNTLATLHEQTGKLKEAETLFEKVAELRKATQGEQHTDYATTIYNLANIKMQFNKLPEAERLLQQALQIHENTVGKYYASYANTLNSLAGLYSEMGNFQLSGDLYLQCKNIYEKVYGNMHPEYGTFLNNLGLYYYQTGDYENSEVMLQKSLQIYIQSFGTQHPENANMFHNLSNTALAKGNNQQAEQYIFNALKLSKANFDSLHPNYLNNLMGVAVFYYNIGNYTKAEKYYQEALQNNKIVYGAQSTQYSNALNNLGSLYLAKALQRKSQKEIDENLMKAEKCFLQTLLIDSLTIGMQHPDYAMHLNNLAELYRNIGNAEKAEPLYLKTLAIEKKVFGEEHPHLAVTYHNIALLYAGLNDFDNAAQYCNLALQIKQKTYGTNNPECAGILFTLAYVYENQNKIQDATETYYQALQLNALQIKNNFAFLSEIEKNNFLATQSQYHEMFSAFAIKNNKNNPQLAAVVYNNTLMNKGLLLQSVSKMKENILNGKDKDLKNKFAQWIGTKQQLAKLYALPASERYQDIAQLEETANQLEKELVSKSDDIKENLDLNQYDWENVKNKLSPSTAVVEWITFNYSLVNHNLQKPDSMGYAALVLRYNDSLPLLIPLCSENAIKKIFGGFSYSDMALVKLVYSSSSKKGLRLYENIWKPLESEFNGINTIYYSPVGSLNQLAIQALPMDENNFIADKYSIHHVLNTIQLPDKNVADNSFTPRSALIIGGIQYETDSTYVAQIAQITNQENALLQRQLRNADTIRSNAGKWSYLPGTAIESQNINQILSVKKVKTKLYQDYQGMEEKIKNMEFVPEIIHIATHGFSYPAPDKNVNATFGNNFMNNPDPLLRTGLVLSGANRVWQGNKAIPQAEDGVLTAYEVANLNLQNTKLVVLSACETGLGEIQGSEGVYGLQRAFKMAGVNNIIMSLWPVPDKETQELMVAFYNNLINLKDIKKAFEDAQQEMRKKYEPYYWAGFVLIE